MTEIVCRCGENSGWHSSHYPRRCMKKGCKTQCQIYTPVTQVTMFEAIKIDQEQKWKYKGGILRVKNLPENFE